MIRKNKGSKKTTDGEAVTMVVSLDTVLVRDRVTGETWTREFIKNIAYSCCVDSPDKRKDAETFAYVVNDARLVGLTRISIPGSRCP